MPIVFVHGVNNRDGAEYRESEISRNGFLREIVAPALRLKPDDLQIYSPYWGKFGAQFAWGMAVLPNPDDKFESFAGVSIKSPAGEALARVTALIAGSPDTLSGDIIADARRDFPAVVELIFASAMAGAKSDEEARALAKSYISAADYAAGTNQPEWLKREDATKDNFVGNLIHSSSMNEIEAFGARDIGVSLKEGLARLMQAIPDKASDLAGKLWRKNLNTTVTRFAGDAFTYLAQREKENKTGTGPIVTEVLNELHKARSNFSENDNKLIVIAHSFGGEIMYEILTHYDINLQVDCLITVGSQVGLFEEMKLYQASKQDLPPNPPVGKLSCPKNVTQWINVFDTNDVFSYRLAPIIDGVTDYIYDTGYSTLSAHGGYFQRPSFYKRLAAHLDGENPT